MPRTLTPSGVRARPAKRRILTKLQGYVTREVVRAFVPAFLVLLFIMLLGFCVQLLHEGLDVVRLGRLPQHVATYCLPWVLPPAFLTAVIMAFGRLSAENEVTAMRTGGVHLRHIIAPVLVLSLILSVVAAYMHFYTGPSARRKIEILKGQAIRQVLMDKVALGAQRQLLFSPCTVQYEDFRDGKMLNVLLIDTQGGVARSITVARSATVKLDPTTPELVYLVLSDCRVTQLEGNRVKGPDAEVFYVPVKVGPNLRDVEQGAKYLSLGQLLARMSELKQRVGNHAKMLANPNEQGDYWRAKIGPVRIAKGELEDEIGRKEKAISKCRDVDRKEQESLIAARREAVQEAEKKKRVLEEQQKGIVEEIDKLKDQKDAYDAKVKEMGEVSSRIAALNKQVAEARGEMEKAGKKIDELETKAAKLTREAADLRVELESVNKTYKELLTSHSMASEQESLRDVRMKIHQRAALSLAVFVFAMLGIPLGIMTRGRSPMVAFGIGFAIVLVLFYPLLVFGQMAAQTGLLPVVPAIWSGNAIMFTIGFMLTVSVLRK